jgi:hypothetical protein
LGENVRSGSDPASLFFSPDRENTNVFFLHGRFGIVVVFVRGRARERRVVVVRGEGGGEEI